MTFKSASVWHRKCQCLAQKLTRKCGNCKCIATWGPPPDVAPVVLGCFGKVVPRMCTTQPTTL